MKKSILMLSTVIGLYGLFGSFQSENAEEDISFNESGTRRSPASTPKLKAKKQLTKKYNPRFQKYKITAKDRLEERFTIFDCMKTQTCVGIPDDDPRMYEMEMGKKLIEELKKLKSANADLEQMSIKDREFLDRSMLVMNGHVQSEALSIYYELPLDHNNLAPVLEGLALSEYDAVLMEKAMPLFSKYYADESYQAEILSFVSGQLQSGGHFTSQFFAKNVDSFLNDNSYSEIKKVYEQSPEGSKVKRYLKAALENHDLMASGG